MTLNVSGTDMESYIAALNASNASIPAGAVIIEFMHSDWSSPVSTAVCAKINNNYGVASCFGYYITNPTTVALSGGTWA